MRIRERGTDGKLKLKTIDTNVRVYVEKVKSNELTINDVPEQYKLSVESLLLSE